MFLKRYARACINWAWMTWRTPTLWRNPIQWMTAYNAAALGRWAWTKAPYVPVEGCPRCFRHRTAKGDEPFAWCLGCGRHVANEGQFFTPDR